jgi:tetratricopeptide (TPR) repeat protein
MSEQGAAQQGEEWVLIGLDEKLAKKQGVPAKVPVPKKEFESLADKGMSIDQIRGWVGTFMSTSAAPRSANWRTENAALVKSFETFIAKKDGWAKAQVAFAKNDFKAAIGALRLICNIDPNDHAAKLNLASALANTRDHEGALKHLDAIRETWSDDAEFHLMRANVLLALNRREEATGELVESLEADPENQAALDGLKGLGILVAIYEDPRDAASLIYVRADSVLQHIESVWAAAERDVAYWLDQINYHANERRPLIVLAAAEKALAKAAGDARLLAAKIGALRELGRIDEALEQARDHASKNDTAAARVELARCLQAKGLGDDARAELDRALEKEPGDLMALDLRFWPKDRHDLEQVQGALPALQAHADKHIEVPGVWRSLARARLAIGDADAALAMFEKAVGLAPKDDDLRAEWWGELARHGKFDAVLADASKISDMKARDWKLRWNEAEAYVGAGRSMEAQAAFAQINQDESLHVDVRKRAKRAAMNVTAPK